MLELCLAHILFAEEGFVHGICLRERKRSVAARNGFQEIEQYRLVVLMGAFFYNDVGALYRSFAAQVSDAVFGRNDIYAVLGVVAVRNVRDYRANQAAFCNRRASLY